ncbi:hypothetical protein Dimus_036468 [Dionaea muscipula]
MDFGFCFVRLSVHLFESFTVFFFIFFLSRFLFLFDPISLSLVRFLCSLRFTFSLSGFHLSFSVLCLGHRLHSPVRLAPPSSLRVRDVVTDGGWLAAYPLAHKKASARTRSRRREDGDASVGLLTEDGAASVVLINDSVSLIVGSESFTGNDRVRCDDVHGSIDAVCSIDSEDSGKVMNVPSKLSLLPVTVEVMNVVGAHGGAGFLVDGVNAQVAVDLVNCPVVPRPVFIRLVRTIFFRRRSGSRLTDRVVLGEVARGVCLFDFKII